MKKIMRWMVVVVALVLVASLAGPVTSPTVASASTLSFASWQGGIPGANSGPFCSGAYQSISINRAADTVTLSSVGDVRTSELGSSCGNGREIWTPTNGLVISEWLYEWAPITGWRLINAGPMVFGGGGYDGNLSVSTGYTFHNMHVAGQCFLSNVSVLGNVNNPPGQDYASWMGWAKWHGVYACG